MVHGQSKPRSLCSAISATSFLTMFFPVFLIVAVACAEAGTKRGSFAFRYTASLTGEELSWLQRFEIVVPAAILPQSQIDVLHQAGSRLFFYAWSTGLYIDNPRRLAPGSWEAKAYKHRKEWLLNPARPDPGPDGSNDAYYYDPYQSSFRRAWVNRLNATRASSGYDGVFFDQVGSLSVPSNLLRKYNSRHPTTPYDRSQANMFDQVSRTGSLVFTNQGYRTAEYYLPVVDYDLTESLITSYAWGQTVTLYVEGEGLEQKQETFYRSWSDLKWILGDIQTAVDQYNPAVKILHLNYTNPLYQPTGATVVVGGVAYPVHRAVIDRAAIYYGYVAAKLWSHDSYSSGSTVEFSQDEIYFTDLGEPLGNRYEERKGVVLRYYEKGVVVLNPSTASQTVDLSSPLVPPGVAGLQDLYGKVTVFGLTVTIDPTPSSASGWVYPSGRVYLFRN